jgi:hypothetical protein
VPGVSVGLLVLVSVAIATGGLMIFRRMTGL